MQAPKYYAHFRTACGCTRMEEIQSPSTPPSEWRFPLIKTPKIHPLAEEDLSLKYDPLPIRIFKLTGSARTSLGSNHEMLIFYYDEYVD